MSPDEPVPFATLLAWWLGELPPEEADAVEERLFTDEETARRVGWLEALHGGVRGLVGSGRHPRVAGTVQLVEQLERGGVRVRNYRVAAGGELQCTVAQEDLVALRLGGDFGAPSVDVTYEIRSEAGVLEAGHMEAVPVDARSGDVVLLHPGDRIRALPRVQVHLRVHAHDRTLDYHLAHTPPGVAPP